MIVIAGKLHQVRLSFESSQGNAFDEGTLRDIAHVAKHFQMPGVGIVPDYDSRIEVMREEGKVDRGVFLQKVFFPVLKYLEVTRHELQAASFAAKEASMQTNAAE